VLQAETLQPMAAFITLSAQRAYTAVRPALQNWLTLKMYVFIPLGKKLKKPGSGHAGDAGQGTFLRRTEMH
jgi:hypothetical protein